MDGMSKPSLRRCDSMIWSLGDFRGRVEAAKHRSFGSD